MQRNLPNSNPNRFIPKSESAIRVSSISVRRLKPRFGFRPRLVSAFIPALLMLCSLGSSPLVAAQLTLKWSDNSQNETGFRIERSVDGTVFTEIAVTGADVESYVDHDVELLTSYWYRVKAYNFAGNSAYSNTASGSAPSVEPANTAPTISNITHQTIGQGASAGPLAFTVGDAQTAVADLIVSGTSSNPAFIPNGNIVFGGSGAGRTVTVTPVSGQSGFATITVTVDDGALSSTGTFIVTVSAPAANTAPTISTIANQTIAQGSSTGVLSFTVGDAQTEAADLIVSGVSSNPALIPNGNIAFGGSGASRTVTVTPASGQSGSATITVTVSDGTLSTIGTFSVAVVAPVANTAPSISTIFDQFIDEGASTGVVLFSIGDAESSVDSLTLVQTSSNVSLVPNENIVLGGSGQNRTVVVTPVMGRTGSAEVRITVSDGILSATEIFEVVVSPISGGGVDVPAPVPVIALENPGANVSEGDQVVIAAALTGDTSNLARIEFYVAGVKIGEATNPPYSFIWSDAPVGQHSITAVSINFDGATSASSPFMMSVVSASRMISLSTRGTIDDANPMINGFVINGTRPQRILLRAVGDGLEAFGVTDVAAEPVISVIALGASTPLLQTNGGWDSSGDPASLIDAMNATGAFPLHGGSRDAAALVDLSPGQYTAVVSDASGIGGTCLIEVYLVDQDPQPSSREKLISLSTRGYAGSGNDALIAGLAVQGTMPKRFLIRGVGPGLSQYGVDEIIGDPEISLIPAGGQSAIAWSGDWSADVASAAEIASVSSTVGAFALAQGSRDAVMIVDLEPGIYTVLLSPQSGQGGSGLIEVYEVSR